MRSFLIPLRLLQRRGFYCFLFLLCFIFGGQLFGSLGTWLGTISWELLFPLGNLALIEQNVLHEMLFSLGYPRVEATYLQRLEGSLQL